MKTLKTASCTVDNTAQAELILGQLQAAGFSNKNISVLFPEKDDIKKFEKEHQTKSSEGTVAGAGTGGVIGGVLGWLVGIGSLAIPGIGPFIAAGPIVAALSGTVIGATFGGLTGTLVGMGIPQDEAKLYENKVKDGRILIVANTEENEVQGFQQACQIFANANAADISQVKAA